jgi:diguanylate cyclase (GGDEF)-like protein
MLAYQAILGYEVNVALIVGSSAVLFLLVAVRMAGMIGERKVLEQRLEFQAMHDPLTHLPNRSLFRDRLELALARTERQGSKKVAVMYVDIDDFKEINDSLGHEAGDKVLLAVAQRLQRCLRPADTVARLGGDEFVVLLEEVEDAQGAVDVAERILESVRAPVVLSMMETRISVSIGITLGDGGHERPADLLRKADLALYSAKGRGKDGYEVFEPGLGERLNL